jgi:hypothetical protein
MLKKRSHIRNSGFTSDLNQPSGSNQISTKDILPVARSKPTKRNKGGKVGSIVLSSSPYMKQLMKEKGEGREKQEITRRKRCGNAKRDA